MKKIAFAGTDGRTFLCALVVSTATSEMYKDSFQGVVVRGTPSMPKFAETMNWPIAFIPTEGNSYDEYAAAIIDALKKEAIDYVVAVTFLKNIAKSSGPRHRLRSIISVIRFVREYSGYAPGEMLPDIFPVRFVSNPY